MKLSLELQLTQRLQLTQTMKLSLNILRMSLSEIEDFVEEEKETKNLPLEIKFPRKYNKDKDLEEEKIIEQVKYEKNFYEFLEEQLLYENIDEKIKKNCSFVINNLNERGYLEISKNEIKKLLGISDEELEETFKVIYSLEPVGIGSSGLEESLKLQLIKKGIEDKKLFLFIDKYLSLFVNGNFEIAKEKLQIDDETLEKYIAEIRKLNPYPLRGYNTEKIRKIVAEIVVENRNGDLICKLNEGNIPKISLRDRSDEFSKESYAKAKNIIELVEKRYTTLLNIANIIVERQRRFLLKETDKVETLRLKEIARELDINISTVSRAIREVYIKTDLGILSLKSLLCRNSDVNVEKEMIEEIIGNENIQKPYSDREITEILNYRGILIARRTVSKYRKELGYSNSNKRKI